MTCVGWCTGCGRIGFSAARYWISHRRIHPVVSTVQTLLSDQLCPLVALGAEFTAHHLPIGRTDSAARYRLSENNERCGRSRTTARTGSAACTVPSAVT